MKFINKTNLKAILLLFMIINSNSISVAANIKLFGLKENKYVKPEKESKPKSNRKEEPKDINVDKCQYGEEFPIDVVTLFTEAISVIRSSFQNDIVTLILNNKYWNKTKENYLEKKCSTLLVQAFNQEIDRIKVEKNLERKVMEETNKFDENVSKIWINKEDRELILSNKENPRKLCEINTELLEKNKNENFEWATQGKFLNERIDRIIEKKYTIEQIREKSNAENNLFSGNGLVYERKRYLNAYKYLADRLKNFENQSPEELKSILLNIKNETIESISVAEKNLEEYKEFTIPKCDRLPSSKINFGKCLIVGYLTYFKAFWNMTKNFNGEKIDKEYLQECLRNVLLNTLMNVILNNLVEAVLEVLAGIVGFLIYKVVKLAFYAINIIYNFIMLKEANDNKDIEKRSIAFGRIIGYSFKVAISIIHLAKKKRNSK